MATREGQGQTALITGASMGIGVDLAECFARDGYDLILSARSEQALQEVAGRPSSAHGVKAVAIPADLGVPGTAFAPVSPGATSAREPAPARPAPPRPARR